MEEFDAALGLTEVSAQQLLARALTEGDYNWVRQLVELRRRRGLSQAELGRLMGRSQSVVSDIESMSSDPRLSTLRRYALAVGARVEHQVVDADLEASIEVPRRVHRMTTPNVPRHRKLGPAPSSKGWQKVNAPAVVTTRILREPVIARA